MAGQDPSRFDYLFEPIGGDTVSAGDDDVEVIDDASVGSGLTVARRLWPTVLAATIVGVGVGMVVVWPSPVDAIEGPTGVDTPVRTAPVVTNDPLIAPEPLRVPPPVPTPEPAAEPTNVEAASEVPPRPQPATAAPSPTRAPTVTSRAPAAKPPPPTVRAPLSVSPVPRTAFPNQPVPDGDGSRSRGGLLGRGGLL